MSNDLALLEIENDVATITLNNPEQLNSIDNAMMSALLRELRRVEQSPSVRCLMLTGAGSAFSAGGRIDSFADLAELPVRLARTIDLAHELVACVAGLKVPVVMALNGVVAGGALGLVLTGDHIVAADIVRFRTAYVALGLVSDAGVSYLLPQALGPRRARNLLLTNRLFTAAEALSWGMIDEVVSSAALMERARQLARNFADGPTGAYRRIKTLLSEASTNSYDRHLARERALMIEAAESADLKEGIRAFLEKRRPVFIGR